MPCAFCAHIQHKPDNASVPWPFQMPLWLDGEGKPVLRFSQWIC